MPSATALACAPTTGCDQMPSPIVSLRDAARGFVEIGTGTANNEDEPLNLTVEVCGE